MKLFSYEIRGYQDITAEEYLERALAPTPGLGPREGRNRIRTAIAVSHPQ